MPLERQTPTPPSPTQPPSTYSVQDNAGMKALQAADASNVNEPTNMECYSTLQQQMHDVEQLGKELKRLLVRYEPAIEQEGIREDVETLERWMESYRRGLSAACKIADNGTACLAELRERLKKTADDLQRLEGEGGNPASANSNQATEAESLIRATKRIDAIIPTVDHLFDSQNDPQNHPPHNSAA
jgi:hypothetical protein